MGIARFCVLFDKPDKVYYPGEKVTGRVELILNSMMTIRGVEIKIKGRAKCKWHQYRARHTVTRKSSEVYIKIEQILIGGRDKFKLRGGVHTYPFSVTLPLKAPSSFSGSHGEILYYGKAKIDIPLSADKENRTEFTVINPLRLSLFPHLRTPHKFEKTKMFWWLCCASGPLAIIARLPKTGFSKFEPIPITLEVNNASNVAVNAIHVYLKREILWTADGYQKHEVSNLQQLGLGGLEARQTRIWRENFTIPSVSFPNIDFCTIIKMDHELHIEAKAGVHSDLDIRIPVTIGDVLLVTDSKPPTGTPQNQNFPNKERDPGRQKPARGVPRPRPTPNPNHNPPAENQPYSGNKDMAPVAVPSSQICLPALPGHIVPQSGMNNAPPNPESPITGEIPQMSTSTQENSFSAQQNPPRALLALPAPPPQPVTNPEGSENTTPPVADVDADDGLTLPSFNSDFS